MVKKVREWLGREDKEEKSVEEYDFKPKFEDGDVVEVDMSTLYKSNHNDIHLNGIKRDGKYVRYVEGVVVGFDEYTSKYIIDFDDNDLFKGYDHRFYSIFVESIVDKNKKR
jgi:hypothetical protein